MTEINEKRFNIEADPPSMAQIEEWKLEAENNIKKYKKRERYAYILLLSVFVIIYVLLFVVLENDRREEFFPYVMGILFMFFLPGFLLWLIDVDFQQQKILEELTEISVENMNSLDTPRLLADLEEYAVKYPSVANYLKKVVDMGRKPLVAEHNMLLFYYKHEEKVQAQEAEIKQAEEALKRIGSLGVGAK